MTAAALEKEELENLWNVFLMNARSVESANMRISTSIIWYTEKLINM